MCQDTTCGSIESSFDTSDEAVELIEVGDASVWEHASSYPYTSRRHPSPRSFSERIFRQVRIDTSPRRDERNLGTGRWGV